MSTTIVTPITPEDFELTPEQQAVAAQLQALIDSDVLPMIQKSIDAFRRELPAMLKTHYGQWVAYHGDERIGFGKSQTGLYEVCFRRGLSRDDFIVGCVVPGAFDPDEEIEVTYWDV